MPGHPPRPSVTLLPLAEAFDQARLSCHWAAQVPAAASRLVSPAADYSHTNLLVEGGQWLGRPLQDGRRAGIDLGDWSLTCGDARWSLAGRTLDEGLLWLAETLGCRDRLEVLPHDLPERPRTQPFEQAGPAHTQLQAWFDLAQDALQDIAATRGGGEVRLWPHHFDLATLIELDPADDDQNEKGGEDARSVNAGLSAGDGSNPEPYFYVTPWPRPESGRDGGLPPLPAGRWHTEGFTAAVLAVRELDPKRSAAQTAQFLTGAVDVAKAMLAPQSA